MVYRNLTRPAAERQWGGGGPNFLKAAGNVVKDSVEIPLLKAEVRAAKGDVSGAEKLLREQRDARPKEPEFWIALAMLTDRKRETALDSVYAGSGAVFATLADPKRLMLANSILDERKGNSATRSNCGSPACASPSTNPQIRRSRS